MCSLSSLWAFWRVLVFLTPIRSAEAIHHMKLNPASWIDAQDSSRLFKVTNLCTDDIYPAIETQGGQGPSQTGFVAAPGNTTDFTVSADWQGRIWARTNCSFDANGTGPAHPGGIDGNGKACLTGDCGGILQCKGTVRFSTFFFLSFCNMFFSRFVVMCCDITQ